MIVPFITWFFRKRGQVDITAKRAEVTGFFEKGFVAVDVGWVKYARRDFTDLQAIAQQRQAAFSITEVKESMPEKARVEPSIECSRCGEPTMASKLEEISGKTVCRGCLSTD